MRQLLVGPAGAGKTCRVLEIIQDHLARNHEQKLLVLLPTESLTSHFRVLLLDNGKINGFTGQFLFTFHSLSYFLVSRKKIFTLARPHQKILLLEEVLKKDCPSSFEGVKTHRGFRQALLKSFKELKENSLAPADFDRILTSFHGQWSRASLDRLSDLIAVYRNYQKALEERGWWEGEDLLSQAARLIKADPGILKGKKLLIADGFYSFTPQEKLILELLLGKVEQTLITLTAPGKKGGIFEPIQKTLNFLAPYQLEKSILETPHRFTSFPLRTIAENFLADDPGPKSAENPQGLQIWEAPDRHAEVEAVAQEIMFLVHRLGFDFADIGIILRQPASYLNLFKEAFTLLNIPWRYWGKEPLTASPWVKTALELGNLLALGWERERVFRLLKSGYFDLELSEVDAWEQKAQQRPLGDEKAWREFLASIENPPAGVQDAKGENIIGRLMEQSLKFRGKNAGTGWAEKYRGVVEEFLLAGALRTVGRQRQQLPLLGVEKFLAMTEEVGRLRSREEIAFSDFLDALSLAVNSAEIFSPDPRRHAVNLIGVHEARQWELPVVFVVGLVEGEFPAPGKEDLFIKDYQRKALQAGGGVDLPLSSVSWEEELLFYLAATRAQKRLYLTYPKGGAARKEILPSVFLQEVEALFPSEVWKGNVFKILPSAWEPPPQEKIHSSLALSLFTLAHREENSLEGQVARWVLLHDQQHPWPRLRLRSTYQENLTLSLEKVRSRDYVYSITELEDFAQCPRAYFYKHLLDLETLEITYREEHEPVLWGNLAHEILERYYTPGQKASFLEILQVVLTRNQERIPSNYLTLREQEALRRNLELFIKRETEREGGYPFQPQKLEWSFGKPTEPLVLETPSGEIKLSGKIDRLDGNPKNNREMLVVDYKYSAEPPKDFMERVDSGRHLQIPLYLLAAQNLLGGQPVGGLLYYLKKKPKSPDSFEEIVGMGREDLWPGNFGGKKVRLCGLKEWQEINSRVKMQVESLVAGIQKGDIRPTPENSDFCGADKCSFYDLCPIRERLFNNYDQG